ncbi:protein tweety homolog 2-like isoform X2 [Ictalurus furcatus]|uniref:protein tweety homolog 2-like isoform X2 n=1 Tax=Ictalurus furcatus TaxID=66913 RepID=UPI0023503570|nr:protein tweety homolog 2-like isoform X2 [Ictalurus furcatus]
MSSSELDYIPPWWIYWLHQFPHINLRLQQINNTFNPQEENYQQSLLFLVCVSSAALGVNLLVLALYLSFLCCCRKKSEADDEDETKKPSSHCVTWTAVTAGLLSCIAVGVGFYGNSETNDGVYQLTYSLYNTNHTLVGAEDLVSSTLDGIQSGLKEHLSRLDEIFATRSDFVKSLKLMQQMAENLIKQLLGLPDWEQAKVDLTHIADRTAVVEYYRWLTYLLILIVDLLICLLACLGLAKKSRCLLTTMMVFSMLILIVSWASLGVDVATAVGVSDFCVSPDKFIMNKTKDVISSDIVHYYLYCSQMLPNPFQQSLTIVQRSLTAMQINVQGLLQFAVPLFPTAESDLLSLKLMLNNSEAQLHQITALLDCRGINKDYLDALMGVCYDGVEGLLYLSLFSLLSVTAFCIMMGVIPRAWTQINNRERDYGDFEDSDPFSSRAQTENLHTFYSYSSSQNSLHSPPAPPTSNRNQSSVFGGNARFEDAPLINRGSPPPSYSPTMRANYLSMSEDQMRHFGDDFRA